MPLYLKQFIQKNQEKLVFAIGYILVFGIAFGLGRLTILTKEITPLSIEEQQSNFLTFREQAEASRQANAPDALLNLNPPLALPGLFVGSKNSNKYHPPDCSWAKKIAPKNQIWFKSELDAKNKGYIPSSCVK